MWWRQLTAAQNVSFSLLISKSHTYMYYQTKRAHPLNLYSSVIWFWLVDNYVNTDFVKIIKKKSKWIPQMSIMLWRCFKLATRLMSYGWVMLPRLSFGIRHVDRVIMYQQKDCWMNSIHLQLTEFTLHVKANIKRRIPIWVVTFPAASWRCRLNVEIIH